MNRNEYMEQLRNAVSGYDAEIRDEIISDYEEHFNIGIMNGKTEEQICSELGSIQELTEELAMLSGRESGSVKVQIDAQAEAKRAESISEESSAERVEGEVVEPEGAPNEGKENGEKNNGAGGNSSEGRNEKEYYRESDFRESFIREMSDMGNAICRGVGVVVNEATRFAKDIAESFEHNENADPFCAYDEAGESADGCDNVIIDTENANVTVKVNPNNKITFDYRNHGSKNQQMAYEFYHRQQLNTIFAGVKRVKSVSFFSRIGSPFIELIVTVPASLKRLVIRTKSGDIDCTGLKAGVLEAESLSGELKLSEVMSEEATLSSASGCIEVYECSFAAGNVNTTSGNVRISGGRAGSLRLLSTSGNVNAEGTAARSISGTSVSGCVKLRAEAQSVFVKTTSGLADVMCRNCTELHGNTVSGRLNVYGAGAADGYSASVNTVSGRIVLSYGAERRSGMKNGTYIFGAGTAKYTLSSVSGGIYVE